jgi:hypothetical protein
MNEISLIRCTVSAAGANSTFNIWQSEDMNTLLTIYFERTESPIKTAPVSKTDKGQ